MSKNIKPGDTVLVKCKVKSVIMTEDETTYNCLPINSEWIFDGMEVLEEDIIAKEGED